MKNIDFDLGLSLICHSEMMPFRNFVIVVLASGLEEASLDELVNPRFVSFRDFIIKEPYSGS